MLKFGDVLFSGSRFIFWVLSPVLLLFAVFIPLGVDSWSRTSILMVAGLDACALLLVLMLYDPKRFHWAGRGVTGIVFLFYLYYLCDEILLGKRWISLSRSEESALNALLGLIVIGLPCLHYAVAGRFPWNQKARPFNTALRRSFAECCDYCGNRLREHDWTLFASTIASEESSSRLIEFFNHVQQHEWRSLRSFSEWEGSANNVGAFVTKCAAGGRMFVMWSPHELYESDQLYTSENIPTAEMSDIEALVPSTAWQSGPPPFAG